MPQNDARKLAHSLVQYSTKVEPGDLVFIYGKGFETRDLVGAVQDVVTQAGAIPYVYFEEAQLTRRFLREADEEAIRKLGEFLLLEMKQAQAYIGIRGGANIYELSDVPKEKMEFYNRYIVGPVHIQQRVKHTRWCVLRYPNPAMSQLAEMSTEAFQQFYYDVCCLDYSRMNDAVAPLVEMMNRAERVRVVSPDTDLSFTKEGIPSVKCAGENNIPDGECFTAPTRESVEGTVRFNTPSVHEGVLFENISLRFEKGKVVEMDAGPNTERLLSILSVDEGASYLGEWALGFNPHILKPMKDTLFDEKIAGSLHMALGACYDDAPNGNHSSLHCDLVLIQRPEYGGGEVYFDDTLIRKDGRFVVTELEGLNPENLR